MALLLKFPEAQLGIDSKPAAALVVTTMALLAKPFCCRHALILNTYQHHPLYRPINNDTLISSMTFLEIYRKLVSGKTSYS